MNTALYEKAGAESMSSEEEFRSYMESRGFTLVAEKVTPNREWLDAFYANDRWDQKSLLGRLGPGVYWPGKVPGTHQWEPAPYLVRGARCTSRSGKAPS